MDYFVSWLKKWAPQRYIYSEPIGVTFFGKRVLADIVKGLKMRWSWTRMDPKSNDTCWGEQSRAGDTERRPCGGTETAAQGRRRHQKLGRGRVGSISEPLKESVPPANTLIPDLWPPQVWGNNFPLRWRHPFCGNLLRQVQETNTLWDKVISLHCCFSV